MVTVKSLHESKGGLGMNQPKLWTKDYLILAFVNFFVALNYYLLIVVMSVFAMDHFASSPSQAGFASSIFVIGTLFARLFSGSAIERIGRRKLLYVGLFLSLALTLGYFAIESILSLFVIRFLHGAAYGVSSTALGTIVASIIPKERCGEGIGYFNLSFTCAAAIGPLLGMFLSQDGDFSVIFLACALSALFSLGATFFLFVPELALTAEYLKEMRGLKLKNFFERKAVPISIVCAVLYFSYSGILSFLSAYVKEIGLWQAGSFFFLIFAFVVLCSRPFVSRRFDTKGENTVMYPGIFLFVIGLLTLSQAYHSFTLLLAAVLIGLGFGVVQSCGQAITVKVTPPHRLSLANSTYFIFIDVFIGLGPFITGLIISFTGYRGMYICAAIVAFFCLFLYYFLHGHKARVTANNPGS